MELEVLAGTHSLVTTLIESGIRFQVDLASVYVLLSQTSLLQLLLLLYQC